MKRILINCSYSDELRVALVDGAKLFDLDNEFNAQALLKGSIFKATVSRVESSLDAAFINFGNERHLQGPKIVSTTVELDAIAVEVRQEEARSFLVCIGYS